MVVRQEQIVCLWVYRGSGESCSPRKSRAPGNVADHIGLIRINCLPRRAHNGERMTGYYVSQSTKMGGAILGICTFCRAVSAGGTKHV